MKFSLVTFLSLALSVAAVPLASTDVAQPQLEARGGTGNGNAIGGLVGSLTGGLGVRLRALRLCTARSQKTERSSKRSRKRQWRKSNFHIILVIAN